MSATTTVIVRGSDGLRLKLRRLMLVVVAGPDRGREKELMGAPLTVGRGDGVGLKLTDPTVSREHCVLEPDPDGVKIKDCGSRTGTRLNGAKISGGVMEPGMRVEIGGTTMELAVVETELVGGRPPGTEYQGLLGASRPMRELFGLVDKVAPLSLPVLIKGETGTGKEGLARALHARGSKPAAPFEVVDCTLLGDLVHARSELFGHEKGAFTGADKARKGAFARADGGTVFLDEVGELPPEIQAQLLRVLQEGEVRPLGAETTMKVSVRLLSATHRDLDKLANEGKFRRDLFFRVSGITLEVPPLRDRGDDLALLAKRFLAEGLRLDPSALAAMAAYRWPGNVRELRFVMERAAVMAKAGVVDAAALGLPAAAGEPGSAAALPAGVAPPSTRERAQALDAASLVDALKRAGGNRKEAAALLGISRATLYRKLEELGLKGSGEP